MDVLTPAARSCLSALVDTVFPAGSDGWSASRIGVVDYVETLLQSPWGDGSAWYRAEPYETDPHPAFGWQTRSTPVEAYRAHLAGLDATAIGRHGRVLADLGADSREQIVADLADDLLPVAAEIRAGTFFELVRNHVLEGVLRDPVFGGNHDGSGWRWFAGDAADVRGEARDVLR